MYDSSPARSDPEYCNIRHPRHAGEERNSLRPGRRVVMTDGPLIGLHGRFVEAADEERFLVSVELTSRSVLIEIDRDWVAPLQEPKSGYAGIPA